MTKLEIACKLSFEEWNATIPASEDLPDPQYSKKHIKRMNSLFNKMRGDKYHRFTTKTIKIMLVAAVLLALMLTAFVIPSSREAIIKTFDIKSRYKMTVNNNNSVTNEIFVGYIPKGFELTEKYYDGKTSWVAYTLNNGKIFTINKHSSMIEVYFDSENIDEKSYTINNITYTSTTDSTGYSVIVWNQNDYIYKIDSNLNIEELLKIAQTVN